MLLQRLHRGGDDVGCEGEIRAVAGKLGFVGSAVAGNGRKIKLKHGGHMRAGVYAAHHVLGDSAAHGGERHNFAGYWCGGERSLTCSHMRPK